MNRFKKKLSDAKTHLKKNLPVYTVIAVSGVITGLSLGIAHTSLKIRNNYKEIVDDVLDTPTMVISEKDRDDIMQGKIYERLYGENVFAIVYRGDLVED